MRVIFVSNSAMIYSPVAAFVHDKNDNEGFSRILIQYNSLPVKEVSLDDYGRTIANLLYMFMTLVVFYEWFLAHVTLDFLK